MPTPNKAHHQYYWTSTIAIVQAPASVTHTPLLCRHNSVYIKIIIQTTRLDIRVSLIRFCDHFTYRKSTIFQCHLIFMGRGESENKKHEIIKHNTKQWYYNDQNLKIKNGEQLKHRNIMNEILWKIRKFHIW